MALTEMRSRRPRAVRTTAAACILVALLLVSLLGPSLSATGSARGETAVLRSPVPPATVRVEGTTGGSSPAGPVSALGALASPSNVLVDAPCQLNGSNAEVQQTYDSARGILYELWIGCGGIGFSRSLDGGRSFQPAFVVPGSVPEGIPGESWDPSIALAPNGTLYVAFIVHVPVTFSQLSYDAPVVAWSVDHGVSFQGWSYVSTPSANVFADRDFLAIAPDGTLYVTWDLAPYANLVRIACNPYASCFYTAGDFNVVFAASTNGGVTWSGATPISPGFPYGGAVAAPLLVEPDGAVDVLYEDYNITNATTHTLGRGFNYFTQSTNGGATWAPRVRLSNASFSPTVWWIDGAIARGADGTLYAGFDAQLSLGADQGWVAVSRDDGAMWSQRALTPAAPSPSGEIMVTPVAGPPGFAYVAWMTDDTPSGGWVTYIQKLTGLTSQITPPRLVSAEVGAARNWTGDTLGLTYLGAGTSAVSWSYGVNGTGSTTTSQVFEARVSYPLDYNLTFHESGLPSSTRWSVTLNRTTASSTTDSLAFQELNGTYAYEVGSLPGYLSTPSFGNVTVEGAPLTVSVAFTSTGSSSSGGFLGLPGSWGYLVVGVILALLAGSAGAVLIQRRRRR